jgi:hypothetical protein
MFLVGNIKYVPKMWGMQPPRVYFISKNQQPNLFTKNIDTVWLGHSNNAPNLLRNHGFLLKNKNGKILYVFSIIKTSNSNFF